VLRLKTGSHILDAVTLIYDKTNTTLRNWRSPGLMLCECYLLMM
jgi:hypothetical protein